MKDKELLNEIYGLYDAYIKKTDELERSKKVTAGLLGITRGPKDDPCHDVFADELKTKLEQFAAEEPDPEETRILLEYIYSVPLKHRDNNMIYWMFMAVHSLTDGLICCLDREDAQKIYKQYESYYPRWERLPAQNKILKALRSKTKTP